MTPRENATAELLAFVEQVLPNSPNRDLYEQLLKEMSDAQFEDYMRRLQSGEETVVIYRPNNAPYDFDRNNLIQMGKRIGVKMLQRVWLTDPSTGVKYRTEAEHALMRIPVRRQVQMLQKKTSIASTNNVVDERSGQAAHESKAGSISYPELQVISARGLEHTAIELIKGRGGDDRAANIINRAISEDGHATLSSLELVPSKAKSNVTMSQYLTGMHLKNTL